MTEECIFCQIVAGELPSKQVFADESVLAFQDINPIAPSHLLVVPRSHATLVADVTAEQEELLGHLVRIAAQVAAEHGLSEDGYRLTINQGADAGQIVDHLHVHVLGGRPLGRMG